MDNIDAMYRMLYNMKMRIWEKSQIYQDYMKTRSLHQEVINSMGKEISSKNLSPQSLLEIVHAPDFELDLRKNFDNNMFGDMIIYKHNDGYLSLTEEYLNKHRFRREDKVAMLEAMKDSKLGIYEFVSRDKQNAVSNMKNILTGEIIPLSDRQLGDVEEPFKDFQCFMRVIHYKNIYFQTGLMMSLKRNHSTRKWVNAHKKEFMSNNQINLLVEAYLFYQINGYANVEARYL